MSRLAALLVISLLGACTEQTFLVSSEDAAGDATTTDGGDGGAGDPDADDAVSPDAASDLASDDPGADDADDATSPDGDGSADAAPADAGDIAADDTDDVSDTDDAADAASDAGDDVFDDGAVDADAADDTVLTPDAADTVDATDASDAADTADASDAADASDGPDASDAADIADAADVSDTTDAADGRDTADATDTSDAADSADAADARDTTDSADAAADDVPFVCGGEVTFSGQIGGPPPGGGELVVGTRPWSLIYPNGNLAAVLAEVPSGTFADVLSADVDIPVSRARVTATSFGTSTNTTFWIADRNASIQVFLGLPDATPPPFDVAVGQEIAFTATRVTWFNGRPQITLATDIELLDEGLQVAVDDSERRIEAADVNVMRMVTGTLGRTLGACGTSTCFELQYGSNTITLRTRSTLAEAGGCMTFVGPVLLFDGVPQLDTVNFDWSWFY